MHKRNAILLLLGSALLAGLLSCSDRLGQPDPNLPPETTLMVDGGSAIDTTHYMQILSWHGEDRDGEVVRFEYKWTLDESVEANGFDTTWVGLVEPFVTASSDTFFLPLSGSSASHFFQVRAVDAEGLEDPTPAEALFPVRNSAPRLYAMQGGTPTDDLTLPDEILPFFTLQFVATDPDSTNWVGESEGWQYWEIEEFRFWFEDSLDYISVDGGAEFLQLRADDFEGLQGDTCTFHLQAIDRAGALSNVISAETYVKDLSSVRVLLLDSCSSTHTPYGQLADSFWRETVVSLFSDPAEVYVHDFRELGALADPEDLPLIFSIFEAILWYNGDVGVADEEDYSASPSPEIQEAESALLDYLESGGNVLISGWNLLGSGVRDLVEEGEEPGPENWSGGSFSEDFESDQLFLDGLNLHSRGGHNSSNYRLGTGPPYFKEIVGFDEAGTSTLRNMVFKPGIDLMLPNPDALISGSIERLYQVSKDAVDPVCEVDGTVGLRRHFDSGGKLVLLSFPLSLAYGYQNHLGEAEVFLQDFGVLP
ncbi:MAG: hypothetical protein QF492_06680 [Candidatus Krumholzibacteria bacterium]|nr:hypothetical protein [Candidatus Krumholzibacteria bacterium]MDP6669568.1 hypothetical protein [Candidatus Krumholzibacteria bacterium]MDP6796534.1 hypothetical protein [Candidatus Krumholzibacteria bacterium]MDP7021745.1 hypothetical protein [Candidatus Krumholzibacteria bacterium]